MILTFPGAERRAAVHKFTNVEMCRITEELIFQEPYQVHLLLDANVCLQGCLGIRFLCLRNMRLCISHVSVDSFVTVCTLGSSSTQFAAQHALGGEHMQS